MDPKTDNIKTRLLLVDSNELIRDIFKMLFERLGYYAVTVRTAREGLKAILLKQMNSNNNILNVNFKTSDALKNK